MKEPRQLPRLGIGGDGDPVRSLSWRFPPVPTLTVTPARCRRALIISRNAPRTMAMLRTEILETKSPHMAGFGLI